MAMPRRRLLDCLLLAGLLALASPVTAGRELTAEQWQADLDRFVQVLRDKHPNPFHRVSEPAFDQEVAKLRSEIPHLGQDQILVGLVRIGAMIGDGHTAIRPYDRMDVYPLKLFWFGDDLRVTGAGPQQREIVGWKVVRIGNLDITSAVKAVDSLIPQGENRYFVMGWNGYWLKNPQALHGLGITESAERASYTFQDDSGRERTLELRGVTNDEYDALDWQSVFQPLPAFMKNQDKSIRYEIQGDGKTLYVSFRSYPGRREMGKISKAICKHIRDDAIEKLVIDLRGNGGGDFKKGLHLIQEIRKTGFLDTGQVYGLTDRWTFSAAMSNAAHLRQQLHAVLVGEPAGERPNGYAENHAFELPRSGIPASCSTRFYEFQDEDTPTLEPDQVIPPSLDAWAKGQDLVLEWVLAQ